MEQKLENLADTMFEAMEDISRVEEKLDKGMAEFEALKSAVEGIKEAQETQSKKVETALADLERLKKLGQNIDSIANSDIINQLRQNIDKKILLKNEVAKYQKMILFILLIVLLGSVAFFWLGFMGHNFISTTNATIIFGGVVAFFIIALLVINSNLKAVISEEKITPKKPAQNSANAIKDSAKKVDSTKKGDSTKSVDSTKKGDSAKNANEKSAEKIDPDSVEIKSTFE